MTLEVERSGSQGEIGKVSCKLADSKIIKLEENIKIKDADRGMAWKIAVEIMKSNSESDLMVGDADENYNHTCEERIRGWVLFRCLILR